MSKYKETLKTLEHIEKLYTIDEIFDLYEIGDYNAELLLQHCLLNVASSPTYPVERVMDKETKKLIKIGFLNAKNDELHYLDQVIKNLKHLEHIYLAGKLEDERKAFGIKNGLKHFYYERDKLAKEIKQIMQN